VVFRITYKVCVLLFKKIINRLFTLSFEVVKIKWVAEKDHLSKRLAVLNVRGEGYSNREIARRIHRSAKVVNNFVEDIEIMEKIIEVAFKLPQQPGERRTILRKASNSTITA
jgi:hypothetical protein